MKSTQNRFKTSKSKSPGPAAYNQDAKPFYIMNGVTEAGFGTSAKRDNLMFRDVMRSPFKDPTIVENPAPDQYSPQKIAQQTSTVNQASALE